MMTMKVLKNTRKKFKKVKNKLKVWFSNLKEGKNWMKTLKS